jgi:hypothetical protein
MPIYLSEYIGSGTTLDRFRPRGSDQPGWSAIDLRADGGATLDGNGLKYCLLHLPVADSDPRLYKLADVKGEDLTLTIRAGMAARLNATINYTRFDDIVADLLLRPPARAWKPLKDKPTQPLEIHLGGLLSPSPALRSLAAQSYDETWSTADSASLTSDLTWTEYLGTELALVSNQCRRTGTGGEGEARAEHALDTDDMQVSMTITSWTVSSANLVLGVLGRKDTAATWTNYCYACQQNYPSATYHLLAKRVAGAETQLVTDTTAYAANERLDLLVNGSTISAYRNGTISANPVTDTAIPSNRYAGIRSYCDGASNVADGDNWNARDFVPKALVMMTSPLRW